MMQIVLKRDSWNKWTNQKVNESDQQIKSTNQIIKRTDKENKQRSVKTH